MILLSLLLCAQVAQPGPTVRRETLRVTLQVAATELRILDPLFVKVTLLNVGTGPIGFAHDLTAGRGGVGFEITADDGKSFGPAFAKGAGLDDTISMPWQLDHGARYACHEVFLSDRNLFLQQRGEYSLKAVIFTANKLRFESVPIRIRISPRPDEEAVAILQRRLSLDAVLDARYCPLQIPDEVEELANLLQSGVLNDALSRLRLISSLHPRTEGQPTTEASLWTQRGRADPVTADLISLLVADQYFRQDAWQEAASALAKLAEPSAVKNGLMNEITYRLKKAKLKKSNILKSAP